MTLSEDVWAHLAELMGSITDRTHSSTLRSLSLVSRSIREACKPALFSFLRVTSDTVLPIPPAILAHVRYMAVSRMPDDTTLRSLRALRSIVVEQSGLQLARIIARLPVQHLNSVWLLQDSGVLVAEAGVAPGSAGRITVSGVRMTWRDLTSCARGPLDFSKLERLAVLSSPDHQEDGVDLSMPLLRHLVVPSRWLSPSFLQRFSLASLRQVFLISTSDSSAEINDLIVTITRAVSLSSLCLLLESGFELLPWSPAQLQHLQQSIRPITRLRRLCIVRPLAQPV